MIIDKDQRQDAVPPIRQLDVVHPGGRYPIFVGSDLLGQLRELAGIAGPMAVLTDSNVGPLYAGRCGPALHVLTIPAGEQHKTLSSVRQLYDGLLACGLDRGGTIVALGGGVVGDMAGFTAATYLRGINFVQCPTTLLAMVDASIGGKTGVDLPQGKNLVGAFKQPAAVLADVSTLQTLPPAEFAAGLAEVVKHGLISDPALLDQLETGQWRLTGDGRPLAAQLQSLIVAAIKVKRDVVQADPFEQGRRALLNLGHTFAHAIEQVSSYAVGHGAAVAMGLVAAAHLSAALGHCSPHLQSRIEAILQRVDLPTRLPPNLPVDALLKAMGHDKKRAGGQLRFVLLRDMGDVFLTSEVPETAVCATLEALKRET